MLDEETEAFTSAGFKRWDQIKKGTRVATFNLKKGTYSFSHVKDVLIQQYHGAMTAVAPMGLSMLMTPDHRVVQYGHCGEHLWSFCPAGNLPSPIYTPIGGAPEGSALEVELDVMRVLGWVLSDGTAHKNGALIISQAVNTCRLGRRVVVEMERVLLPLFPDVTVTDVDRRGGNPHQSLTKIFYIGAASCREKLLPLLGGKLELKETRRVPRHLIEQANRPELEALYLGLYEGDGGGAKERTRFYPGVNEGLADDFQEIATRLGKRTNKRLQPERRPARDCWTVAVWKTRRYDVRKERTETERYKGTTWGLVVPNGAFVARRSGTVFVTGGSLPAGTKRTK